ncbi:flagellar hook assembly protein FlgD [Lysinibacillus sp. 2017]|uniref:flagellar hook assembly protein FlgD n=1 Tax=unclassified Lysinibacillus TaxID=2636778 RepID=UPI000D527FE8|nr:MULTISPECIES: flagellar hook assembly protein FlgD [unclassified Lysinibacillus]AWE06679.1 flagellar hook assembly protein FlgD [Lysinibacillus sp. 2017]TGN37389.1 flagellar hook assembly protein FlgD [Lysinibacillus sp. S2017]
MANGISNDYYLPANNPNFKVTDKADNGALGKDAFLKILITQLQNQDPTSPMDDKEFISQMAQFSSLEQMQNMTKAMGDLLASQQQSQLMNYSTFVGKEVKWHELTDKLDDKGTPIYNDGTGQIKELKFIDGEAVFVLADGKEIKPGNISSILGGGEATSTTPKVPTNPLVQASEMLGKTVAYTSATTSELVQEIIESIVNKSNGEIEYLLADGSRLTKDQFTVVENSTETKDDEEQVAESETVTE